MKNYIKRNSIMTQTEQNFYKLLKLITTKYNCEIFAQVSLYSIIQPLNYKALNRIRSKSIDYVITDKEYNIKLCIELDDYTHNKQERIKRDNFVNNIFKKTKIKLLRIPIEQAFIVERIEKQIKESL